MHKKKILIAAFIFKDRLNWFLNYLETEFRLPKNKVFVYTNLNDSNQLICTFHLMITNKINIKNHFNSAIILHKKKKTFYTINALNKLIEFDSNLDIGNIDYKQYKIDWNKYQDKIILNNHNKLVIIDIKRFFY